MPAPIALCIERIDSPSGDCYMRCVADVGRRGVLGLGIDGRGRATWQSPEGLACELFATADDRLGLRRPEGAVEVQVHRGGRSLAVPPGKPVILLDQDELVVGAVRLRVHVHGEATRVRPPTPLVPAPVRRFAAIAATAVALGAATLACRKGEDTDSHPIDVRDQPPKVAGPPPPSASAALSSPDGGDDAEDGADQDAADAGDASDASAGDASDAAVAGRADAGARKRAPQKPPRIEVRDLPPYVE